MSAAPPSPAPAVPPSVTARLGQWASEHKALVYTVGAVITVTTGAGIVYYLTRPATGSSSGSGADATATKKSKKERRKAKQQASGSPNEVPSGEGSGKGNSPRPPSSPLTSPAKAAAAQVEPEPDLPEINETTVETFDVEVPIWPSRLARRANRHQKRKEYASTLKAAGNKAFGAKDYDRAIDLYTKAVLCKPDPIYYSNRAACYNARGDWQMVIDDTSAALKLDSEYLKALNRRGSAYENLENYSEALIDYTASCIIDGFRTPQSAESVERLLKKLAEQKGKAILAGKEKKLPSPGFISNYLNSFRPKPDPSGMEKTPLPHSDDGKGQLRLGLEALKKKTAEGYEEAAKAFEKAIELGKLDKAEAAAYNLRGTFRYLRGDNTDAKADLTKSIELNPNMTQSYVKRASIHLELGACHRPS